MTTNVAGYFGEIPSLIPSLSYVSYAMLWKIIVIITMVIPTQVIFDRIWYL